MRSCALFLLAACAGSPDEFNVGYGHEFRDDGFIADKWAAEEGDSDFVNFGLTWHLKPRAVVVQNPVAPPVQPLRWTLEPDQTEARKGWGGPVKDDPAPEPAKPPATGVLDYLKTFDGLDWVTRVALLVAVCWLGYVYRAQLAKLIPRRKKSKP